MQAHNLLAAINNKDKSLNNAST